MLETANSADLDDVGLPPGLRAKLSFGLQGCAKYKAAFADSKDCAAAVTLPLDPCTRG